MYPSFLIRPASRFHTVLDRAGVASAVGTLIFAVATLAALFLPLDESPTRTRDPLPLTPKIALRAPSGLAR